MIPKHIVFNGNDIKMIGYSCDPLKDFLLSPKIEGENDYMYYESKVLSFKIKRDANNWHTMEGGGFLFGATIDYGILYGYCVLVTENGLKLYELKNIDIEKFRNGKLGNIAYVGVELGKYDIGNVLADHKLTLRLNNDHCISLWDGDKVVIEEYKLDQLYGRSFGPITSHISHACSQISYYTFSDIQISIIEE